jgi:hypothetical protein
VENDKPGASLLSWRKSARSLGNGACVEVAASADSLAVRDSTLGIESPVLGYSPRVWTSFLGQVKNSQS